VESDSVVVKDEDGLDVSSLIKRVEGNIVIMKYRMNGEYEVKYNA
jgi:hypothetical protein